MTDVVYNSIGINYNKNRAADPRILKVMTRLLDLPMGSVIADIGAGTGNYSNALADLGFIIKAIEPSEEMRRQAKSHIHVTWIPGTAESIPLKDNSVDGVVIILALHHFHSLKQVSTELHRICPKGPIVLFTLDPREGKVPWFKDYFPDIYRKDFKTFPPIARIFEILAFDNRWSKIIEPFPLPHDLADKNMYSAWRNPERYLDEQFRKNTSGFALASEPIVRSGVDRLRSDLRTGKWDKKYGDLRNKTFFDAGFKFIKCAFS